MNDFLDTTIGGLSVNQFPKLDHFKKYILDENSKVRVYKNLILNSDLSLDLEEENSENDYSAIFVENDLEVTGNICNYGHGGIALYVLGKTTANNFISTGSIKILNSLFIKNILLGAYSEGYIEAEQLNAKLVLNDNHTISIKGKKDVSYSIVKDELEPEKEEEIAKCFIKNKVLEKFTDNDIQDNEYFIDFSPMVNSIYFNGQEIQITNEIVKCLTRQ